MDNVQHITGKGSRKLATDGHKPVLAIAYVSVCGLLNDVNSSDNMALNNSVISW
jgi:hypothetical protein